MSGPGSTSSQPTALSRFTPAELVVGAGCVALLISLVLPWMGGGGSATVHAWSGFGLVTILVWLVVSGWFVARSPWLRNTVSLRQRTLSDGLVFIVGGIAEVVTVLIYYGEHHSSGFGIDRSVRFGWVLALLAGIATAGGGYLMSQRSRGAAGAAETIPAAAPHVDPLPPATPDTRSTRSVAPEGQTNNPLDGPGIV